jgi:acyl homoserine lactone synthase
MIKIIPGELRSRYPRLIDEMHQLRRGVFHERLQWQVPVINEWEVDGYDALDPLYVLSLDDSMRVIGGVRLLPTTGLNMLNDTFPELLPDGVRIESPLIWEASRFTVRMTGNRCVDIPIVGRATAELLLAMNQLGMALGLSHIVAVCDHAMHRLLLRSGCAGAPLGPPRMIGGVKTSSVLVELGPELDARIRASTRVADVMLDQAIIEGIRERCGACSKLSLRLYCGSLPSTKACHNVHYDRNAVTIPRQSRGLYDASRSKRLRRPLTRPTHALIRTPAASGQISILSRDARASLPLAFPDP